MIRRALLAVLLFLAARVSLASDMQLWFDPDGTTYLQNTTANPISFDGYQISSETLALDPAGWDSISDRVPARINDLILQLGAGALTFGEANPGTGNLAEVNLGGAGTLAAGAKFSLGKPFKAGVDPMAQDFFYKLAVPPGPNGPIVLLGAIVPEPSTCVLAALAGLGLVTFRVRGLRVSPCGPQ